MWNARALLNPGFCSDSTWCEDHKGEESAEPQGPKMYGTSVGNRNKMSFHRLRAAACLEAWRVWSQVGSTEPSNLAQKQTTMIITCSISSNIFLGSCRMIMWFYLLFLLLQLSTYDTCSVHLVPSALIIAPDGPSATQPNLACCGPESRTPTETAFARRPWKLYCYDLHNVELVWICGFVVDTCWQSHVILYPQWSSQDIWTGQGPGLKCAPTPRECHYYVFSQAGGVDLWVRRLILPSRTATWCDSALYIRLYQPWVRQRYYEILWDAELVGLIHRSYSETIPTWNSDPFQVWRPSPFVAVTMRQRILSEKF